MDRLSYFRMLNTSQKYPKHIRRNDQDRKQVETLTFLFEGGKVDVYILQRSDENIT